MVRHWSGVTAGGRPSSILDRNRTATMHIQRLQMEQDVFNAVVVGAFKLSLAEIQFIELLAEAVRCGATKILIDGEEITGNPTQFERFLYGEFVAEAVKRLGAETVPVFAYVLHEPVLDPMRFGETVALNRGMNLKVFDDYDLAIDWLGVIPLDYESKNC